MRPKPVEIRIPAGTFLQHISREKNRGDALYYGKDAVNRFDDPAGAFGVLYLVYDLATGLMETVFHDHRWDRTASQRSISTPELQSRMVRVVNVRDDLDLCDLASLGAAVKGFGRNAAQLSTRRYATTQALCAAIAQLVGSNKKPYDGILYPSRDNQQPRVRSAWHCLNMRTQRSKLLRTSDSTITATGHLFSTTFRLLP